MFCCNWLQLKPALTFNYDGDHFQNMRGENVLQNSTYRFDGTLARDSIFLELWRTFYLGKQGTTIIIRA